MTPTLRISLRVACSLAILIALAAWEHKAKGIEFPGLAR
jgi:hypothetical protein